MDETVLCRLIGFAKSLRESADLLLDKGGILSLDTWTFYEIEEAFSLILQVEQHTNFHVLPTNHSHHPAIPLLQFVYDLLQRVQKIRIWTKPAQPLPTEQVINLRCLRNLHLLQIDNVPLSQLKGLQNLRPTLKSLIISGVSFDLSSLFLHCGADKSSEFLWENLSVAVLSRNKIQLDSSLRLLSAIRVLDLSYCELHDASAILYLPKVSHVNLSYNKLSSFPSFSTTTAYSLLTLNVKNNLIIQMKGLEFLTNLEELDMGYNLLSIELSLRPLSHLPHLKCLNMEGNPISFNLNYRIHTLHNLNPAIIFFNKFIFDGVALDPEECEQIGTLSEKYPLKQFNLQLEESFSSTLTNILTPPLSEGDTPTRKSSSGFVHGLQAVEIHATEQDVSTSYKRRKVRKRRERHVSILDPDEERVALDHHTPSSSHTSQPEQPSLSTTNNNEENLNTNFSSSLLTATSLLEHSDHFPGHSDKLLEEILANSAHDDYMYGAHKLPHTSTENVVTMESSMISSTNSSFFKADEHAADETYSRQSSEEFSAIASENEDGENTLLNFLAKVQIDGHLTTPQSGGEQAATEDIILTLSSSMLREKNAITCKTITSWPVSMVEGLEVLTADPFKVRLDFHSTKKEDSTRTYFIEPDEFESLKTSLESLHEDNASKTFLTDTSLQCTKCNKIINEYSTDAELLPCGECGGGLSPIKRYTTQKLEELNVLNQTLTPFPKRLSLRFHSPAPDAMPATQASETSSGRGESSESVSVCSEGSHKRASSDGTSSHSISSIEVLTEQQNGIAAHRQAQELEVPVSAPYSSDARTPPNSHVLSNPDVTPMQESSSSGSMSGSVCTTLDNGASGPGTPLHQRDSQDSSQEFDPMQLAISRNSTDNGSMGSHETTANVPLHSSVQIGTPQSYVEAHIGSNKSIPCLSASCKSTETVCHSMLLAENGSTVDGILIEEHSSAPSFSAWRKSLSSTYTGYCSNLREDSLLSGGNSEASSNFLFPYDDASPIDHRLKLYFEVFLFHDDEEVLLKLIKAVIMIRDGNGSSSPGFSGLLAVSSSKLYILEIIHEESDDPQDWLQEKLSCPTDEISCITTLLNNQGIGLTMAETNILICLADSRIGKWALKSLCSLLDNSCSSESKSKKTPENKSIVTLQSEVLAASLNSTDAYNLSTEDSHFTIVSLLQDDGKSSSQFLIITSSHLFVFQADLNWYLLSEEGPTSDLKLVCTKMEGMTDLASIDIYSKNLVNLKFNHEDQKLKDTSWILHFADANSTCEVVRIIRPLWEDIFQLDLEVRCFFVPTNTFLKWLKQSPL